MKAIRIRVVAMFIALMSFNMTALANTAPLSIVNEKTGKQYEFSSIAITNLIQLKGLLKDLNLSQHAEILQSMMMVETRAGTGGQIGLPNAHPSLRSYGLMQVTVPTARVMFKRFPELFDQFFSGRSLAKVTDKEIKNLLLSNNKANILLGIHVFTLYLDMVNGEVDRAIAAYNMGIGNALKRKGAPKAKYVQDVKAWMPTIVAFNREYEFTQQATMRMESISVDIEESLIDNQTITIPIGGEEQYGEENTKEANI